MRRGVNLRSLAKELGLSVTTVSRAIKDGPEVKWATRQRVKEAAAQAGYVPNMTGVHLRTGRTMKICSILYTPESGEYGEGGFLAQVDRMAQKLEESLYNLIITTQTNENNSLPTARRVVEQKLADALVFSRTTPLDERAKFCLEQGFPFVTFGRTELLTEHAFVDRDDENAIEDAVGHLAVAGHRKIAFLNPAGGLTYLKSRHRGYLRGMAEAGLSYSPALMKEVPATIWAHRKCVAELLANDPSISAIIASNQASVIGVLEGLADLGRDRTNGIEVVGFGGVPVHLMHSENVVYYFQSQQDTGALLARYALDLLDGVPAEELQTVIPYKRVENVDDFRKSLPLEFSVI